MMKHSKAIFRKMKNNFKDFYSSRQIFTIYLLYCIISSKSFIDSHPPNLKCYNLSMFQANEIFFFVHSHIVGPTYYNHKGR